MTKSTKNAQLKQTQEKRTFSSESGYSELVLLLKVGGNSPGLRTQVVPIVSSGTPTPQSPLPSFSLLEYLPSSVVPLAENEVWSISPEAVAAGLYICSLGSFLFPIRKLVLPISLESKNTLTC